MRPYSMDLRERVWADCQAGMATPAVAEKYRVSPSWVRRLKQRQKATGSLAPRPPSPGRPVVLSPHNARLRELVRDDPDATLAVPPGQHDVRRTRRESLGLRGGPYLLRRVRPEYEPVSLLGDEL